MTNSFYFFKLLRGLYYLYETWKRNSIFIFFCDQLMLLYIILRNIFFELFLFSIYNICLQNLLIFQITNFFVFLWNFIELIIFDDLLNLRIISIRSSKRACNTLKLCILIKITLNIFIQLFHNQIRISILIFSFILQLLLDLFNICFNWYLVQIIFLILILNFLCIIQLWNVIVALL